MLSIEYNPRLILSLFLMLSSVSFCLYSSFFQLSYLISVFACRPVEGVCDPQCFGDEGLLTITEIHRISSFYFFTYLWPLQLLTYEKTGAVVAAVTTSLPEILGALFIDMCFVFHMCVNAYISLLFFGICTT